jgi:hypothetical protein
MPRKRPGYPPAYIICVSQPYASFLMLGLKGYETRGWSTYFRGMLIIQATQKPMTAKLRRLWERVIGEHDVKVPDYLHPDIALGRVLGSVQLRDCTYMTPDFIASVSDLERSMGYWKIGNSAWRVANPQYVARPIPWSGQVGLRPVPGRLANVLASEGILLPQAA